MESWPTTGTRGQSELISPGSFLPPWSHFLLHPGPTSRSRCLAYFSLRLVSPVLALHVSELCSVHAFESGFTHVCEAHLCCCGCQQCPSGSRAFSCMFTPRCLECCPGCWGVVPCDGFGVWHIPLKNVLLCPAQVFRRCLGNSFDAVALGFIISLHSSTFILNSVSGQNPYSPRMWFLYSGVALTLPLASSSSSPPRQTRVPPPWPLV